MASGPENREASPKQKAERKNDAIKAIRVLYICDLPESLIDARVMREHFSQFAPVKRVYVSLKRRSCMLHFNSHEEADYAREHGAILDGEELKIFWSHSKNPDAKAKKLQMVLEGTRQSRRNYDSEEDEEYTDDEDIEERRKDKVVEKQREVIDMGHKSVFKSVLRKSSEPIAFGGTSNVFDSSSQQPESKEDTSRSVNKQRKYTIKLAQKVVRNCKRKEYLLYRAKRSTSHCEDIRNEEEAGSQRSSASIELPPEVVDELKALGNLNPARVLERPKDVMQLPWKKEDGRSSHRHKIEVGKNSHVMEVSEDISSRRSKSENRKKAHAMEVSDDISTHRSKSEARKKVHAMEVSEDISSHRSKSEGRKKVHTMEVSDSISKHRSKSEATKIGHATEVSEDTFTHRSRSEARKKAHAMELSEDTASRWLKSEGIRKSSAVEFPEVVSPRKLKSEARKKAHAMELSEDTASRWLKTEVSKKSAESLKAEEPEFEVSPSTVKELEYLLRQPAHTFEVKYRVLESRDKLMQIKKVQLSTRKNNHGTCPDMCPEKERYLRKIRHQVDYFETQLDDSVDGYHQYAVKQYARSSADQQMPLAHDLRPVTVLRMTMNHLIREFMDLADSSRESLGDWYHFLWDRTRSIRKDITQQEICDLDSVIIVEQCARFHIFCSERMREEDVAVYDEKINTENLTKCLQTLKYMYGDLAVKGIVCPNEPEFQAFKVLLNLNSGAFMMDVQSLQNNVQHSKEIKFAIQVYLALSDNNYVRFFKLVKSTTYLNACILHRYFHQVRAKAIHTMIAAYGSRKRETYFPLADIQRLLVFDNIAEAAEFCRFLHLKVVEEHVSLQVVRKTFAADTPLVLKRSHAAIESKKLCPVSQVIAGSAVSRDEFPLHAPHNSFDVNGVLKPEAWNAEDQVPGKRKESPEPPIETPRPPPPPPSLSAKDVRPTWGIPPSEFPAKGVHPTWDIPAPESPAKGVHPSWDIPPSESPVKGVLPTRDVSLFDSAARNVRPTWDVPPFDSAAKDVRPTWNVPLLDSPVKEVPLFVSPPKDGPSFMLPSENAPSVAASSKDIPLFFLPPKEIAPANNIPSFFPPSKEVPSVSATSKDISSFFTPFRFAFPATTPKQDVSKQAEPREKDQVPVAMETFKFVSPAFAPTSQEKIPSFQFGPVLVPAEKTVVPPVSEPAAQLGEEANQLEDGVIIVEAAPHSSDSDTSPQQEEEQETDAEEEEEEEVEEEEEEDDDETVLLEKDSQERLQELEDVEEQERIEDREDELEERLSAEEPSGREVAVQYANPNFSAWFSQLSLAEQAEALRIPGVLDCDFKENRNPRQFYVQENRSWPDIGSVRLGSIIPAELYRRLHEMSMLEQEMVWKVLLSVPDPDESPRYSDELLKWVDETFCEDKRKLPDVPQQLDNLRVSRDRTPHGVLNSCVQRLVGYNEDADPLLGVNGILFFESGDSEDNYRYERLLGILKSRKPLPLLPIAVITDRQRLLAKDRKWLQQLVDMACISDFKLLCRTSASVEEATAMVVSALKWLATNTAKSPDFEVIPLKVLWDQLVVDDVWSRILHLTSRGLEWNPNELIELHNSALDLIFNSCLNDELYEYCTGAPELSALLEQSFYSPKAFTNQIMPDDWGTEEYKNTIRKACKTARIPRKLDILSVGQLPIEEFVRACLNTYPELNKELNHFVWVLCQNEELAENVKPAHIIQALAEIQLERGARELSDIGFLVAISKQDKKSFRKQYSYKLFLPAPDVPVSLSDSDWSLLDDTGPSANKRTKLDSEDVFVTPSYKPISLEEEVGRIKADYEESNRWLLEMAAKIKENEIAMEKDLEMIQLRRKRPAPRKEGPT